MNLDQLEEDLAGTELECEPAHLQRECLEGWTLLLRADIPSEQLCWKHRRHFEVDSAGVCGAAGIVVGFVVVVVVVRATPADAAVDSVVSSLLVHQYSKICTVPKTAERAPTAYVSFE
jgi:hypothetical protein